MAKLNKSLTTKEHDELINTLKNRFQKNINRHKAVEWGKVQAKFEANRDNLWSLYEMEKTEREPDVVGYDKKTNEFIFMDCLIENPKGRRILCNDREALELRKEYKPKNSAVDLATEMEIELLTKAEYRELQKLSYFDIKTSSWLKITESIRKLVEAIFGNFRFEIVFVYHNGVESYYAARGFRGLLRI